MILDKLTRSRIYNAGGKQVDIPWPKDAPEPKVGHKYTIQTAADKPGEARFIVDSYREQGDGGIVATVRVDADPTRLLGKSGGYSSAAQGAISTRKAPEPDAAGGPQFRAEVEPEAVDEETQRRITAQGRHNRAEFQRELAEENEELAEELARRRERAIRTKLRETLKGLGPDAATELLGAIERDIRKAQMREAA